MGLGTFPLVQTCPQGDAETPLLSTDPDMFFCPPQGVQAATDDHGQVNSPLVTAYGEGSDTGGLVMGPVQRGK